MRIRDLGVFFFVLISCYCLFGEENINLWNNVLDGANKILADKTIEFDGKIFKDKELGYKIKMPENVYLEYTDNVFVCDTNILYNVSLDKYRNKYFILIVKSNLEKEFGKDYYKNVLKKYEEKYKNKKINLILDSKRNIIGGCGELANEAIFSPSGDIYIIKNGFWCGIAVVYFSLGEMQNKYSHLLEISNEPGSVGELVWKKEVIKMIKDKSKDAPPELVKLYEIFQSVLNSLEFDDGKPEILWVNKFF